MKASTIPLEQHLSEVSEWKKNVQSLENKVSYLEEQIEWFRRQIFGQKADKFVDSNDYQLRFDGFDDLTTNSTVEKKHIAAHERTKRKPSGKDKITLPENLPVETQILDIPEEAKICPKTGKVLVKIGEEVTSKLALKRGQYFIKQIIRPKYALPHHEGVLTAPITDSLLERCQADESLLADILVKKFCDHLPLYRQSEIMARDGILISRQTLNQWVLRSALALKPLKDLMTKYILESGNVFIDETPISLQDPGKGKTQTAYMWVLVGGETPSPYYRIYDFYNNRKHSNVEKILKSYNQVLHSDKFGGYEALANQKQIIWAPCYAHIRRKFVEAESGDLTFRDWVLRKIRHLFMLERVAWSRSEEERLRIRREKEVPIIDELIAAVKDKLVNGKILPKSKFKEALGYFVSLIPYLKNYTLHAFARLDNNVAERAVRPLAIGRKNWLFIGSQEGGEAAATIFSLVQTCRAININPREYLEDVMRRIMSHPANRLEELLPDEWAHSKGLLDLA